MKTETQKVDVLAVMTRDAVHADGDRIGRQVSGREGESPADTRARWRNESSQALAAVAQLIEATARTIRYADSEPDGGEQVEVSRANIEQLRTALGRVGSAS